MTKEEIQLRAMVTESQAERVQERLSALPFKVNYQQKQHGASLVACIACTRAQRKLIQDILHDLGAAISGLLED